jgi:hypothetical protein
MDGLDIDPCHLRKSTAIRFLPLVFKWISYSCSVHRHISILSFIYVRALLSVLQCTDASACSQHLVFCLWRRPGWSIADHHAARSRLGRLGVGKRVLARSPLDLDAVFRRRRGERFCLLAGRRMVVPAATMESILIERLRSALGDSDRGQRYSPDFEEASDERDQGPGA